VDFDDGFPIVMDTQCGFWFLPGGGLERTESVEEAAKREAVEELGLQIRIRKIAETFHVTLNSRETGEKLRIHPFVVAYATVARGQLKTEYAPKRIIVFMKKDACNSLLKDFEIPEEYECMKPYLYVSREVVREFLSLI
jgi:ADP-ribose pyrophosphatase YjhB (NUDIX family)